MNANRHLVAGSAVVAVVLNAILGGPAVYSALAATAILVIAALAPVRNVEQVDGQDRQAGGRDDIERLGAIRLANAISDPLVIFSAKSQVVYQNEAAKAAFGEMPLGRDLRTAFRSPEMIKLINEITATGRSLTADMSERLPVERSFRVIGDPVGEGSGLFILLFKDQSEARRIDRMRSDFIANASHELRTPLASVAGFIETLRGPARNDEKARNQFLEIMQEQTSRMSRLIDDLLSLSRVEMKPNLSPGQTVDLRPLIDNVVETLSPMANDLDVKIERKFQDDKFTVEGDRDELFQVFQNLVENACKYGHEGGSVVVSLETAERNGRNCVVATVKDFGPGISAEHLPRITERFYRVDVDTSRAKKGTGLGLSIVKHIVNRHKADLRIKSEPGKGAEFSVVFALPPGTYLPEMGAD